ncbi:MAG: glycosyltransferase family 4 protein [Alphaproteobacteria bacterium]|nr:glycosyltransferase family 4 protein [Alphaproteobacteria bacterium]
MKIAFLVTRLDEFGGVQIHIRDLSTWLNNQGHEALVYSGWPGIISDHIKAMGTDYFEVHDMGRPIHPVKDIKSIIQLRRYLKKHKPDILSCHSSKAGIVGRMAAIGLPTKVIFTAHGWAFTEGVSNGARIAYKWIEKCAAPFCSKIITVSEYDRQLALSHKIAKPEKIIAIHNGMPERPAPVRTPKDNAAQPVKLIMVARFAAQKDHDTLLRALKLIKDKNWHVSLCGNGDSLPTQQLAVELGLTDKIDFLGERDDVPELLEKHDVFLLITHWEGFPRSIIEAMRAGLPSIATDVAGNGESITHGKTGYLVKHKDAEDVAHAITKIVEDETLRLDMGKAARATYEEQFTFLHMAKQNLALYEALLDKA